MTEKQEKILGAALTLFAEHGFDATSTSKVANAAGVSEGLIFRHFKNKNGLLAAIMNMGQEKAQELYAELFATGDAKTILRGILTMPFEAAEEDFHFWKLLYALKWQAKVYDDSISAPIKKVVKQAFADLKYSNPDAEAEVFMMLVDGIATGMLLRNPKNQKQILNALLEKYNI